MEETKTNQEIIPVTNQEEINKLTVIERLSSETPPFFRKAQWILGIAGVIITGVSQTLDALSIGTNIQDIVTTIGVVISVLGVTVAQLAVKSK